MYLSMPKHAKAMPKHAKACSSMPKQAKTSFFDLIYKIKVVGNRLRMYLSMPKQCQSMPKQCQSMPKHAKAG